MTQTDTPNRSVGAADDSARWRKFAILGPFGAVAFIVGPILLAWNSLPDPLAMSWRNGEAINLRSPGTLLGFSATFAVVCALLFVLGGTRQLRGDSFNVAAVLVGVAMTSVFALQSVSTVLANRGLLDGSSAPEPGVGWTIAIVAAPLIAVALVGMFFRDVLVASPPTIESAPTAGLTLGASESAVWHSRALAPWPAGLAAAAWLVPLAMLLASLFVNSVFWVAFAATVIITAAATAFAYVRVSVDRRGLTVRYGWLPWPRTHIALDSIVGADAAHVRPGDQGGWGYRGSRAVLGKAAVVVRSGEGIHLHLEQGREFIVTVDNAAVGAGVLNDLRAAKTGSSVPS